MAGAAKMVFRPRAIQRYLKRRRQPEFPALVRPRGFALLWVALLLASAGMALAVGADLPVIASGQALLLPTTGAKGPAGRSMEVLVLLPPQWHEQLAAGQKVLLELPQQPTVLARTTQVESRVLNDRELRRRWEDLTTTGAVRGPAAVTLARCVDPCDPALLAGALVPARVVLGKRSLLDRVVPQWGRKP